MLWLTLAWLLTVPTSLPAPIEVRDDGDVQVLVHVNDHGPFRFLLDTGSSRSAVSTRLAARLALPVTRVSRLVTPTATTTVPLARALRLRVPPAGPRVIEPMVLDERQLVAPDVEGIVGQDVLAALSYTIDYQRHRLSIHGRGVGHEPGVRLPYAVRAGQPLVPVTVDGEATLALVADSGADRVVLFDEIGRRPVADAPGVLRDLAGQRPVSTVVLDRIHAGDLQLRNVSAVVLATRPMDGLMSDGLLPLSLFSRVTFCAESRVVILTR
jgi:predicted aspartyl protease